MMHYSLLTPPASVRLSSLLFAVLLGSAAPAVAQTWQWAVKTGQTTVNETSPTRTAVDAAGNVLVAGEFDGTVAFGSQTFTAHAGEDDAFLAQYSSSGQLLWALQVGGSGKEEVQGLSTDPAGNVFLAVGFESDSISVGGSTFVNHAPTGGGSGDSDALIIKLSSGGQVAWARQLGAAGDDEVGGLISTAGEVYVAGSHDNPLQMGGFTIGGSGVVFVARLDAAGNWVWGAGGGSADTGSGSNRPDLGATGITLSGRQVFITGSFADSARFGQSRLLARTTGPLSPDAFVASLNAGNGQWLWAQRAGGTGADQGTAIAADGAGSLLVTGVFTSPWIVAGTDTVFHASPAALQHNNAYVARLDTTGSWQWATGLGSGADVWASALVIGPTGDAYVAGAFAGSLQIGSYQLTPSVAGEYSGFLTRLESMTGLAWWATFVDAHGDDPSDVDEVLTALARDAAGDLYLAGSYDDQATFGTTTLVTTLSRVDDGFLARFADVLPLLRTISPAVAPVGATITLTGQNLGTATAVTFNGVPATFTVSGPNQITVTVPTGATNGYVSVTTPAGTVNSPVAFRVGPTGLADEGGAAFSLWPNPATSSVRLSGELTAPVQLLDGVGRVVRSLGSLHLTAQGQQLDLSGLPAGLYTVRVGSAARRLVVE